MKPGIGGDDTGGRVNEIDSIAAGVTGGDQSVTLHNDALQRCARIGDGGNGGSVGADNADQGVACGHINITDTVQRHSAGIGQSGGIYGLQFAEIVEFDTGAVFAVALVEDKDI